MVSGCAFSCASERLSDAEFCLQACDGLPRAIHNNDLALLDLGPHQTLPEEGGVKTGSEVSTRAVFALILSADGRGSKRK